MPFRFDPQKFHLGMRTIKTGISIFIIILFFHVLGWKEFQIAALTATFSLRENLDKSISFGASRILGNSIGAIMALFYYFIWIIFGESFWLVLFAIPILSMLTIMVNVSFDNKAGVIGAVAAFLIITLSIPEKNTIIFVLSRILETFIGVFIAMLVNADVKKIRHYLKKSK